MWPEKVRQIWPRRCQVPSWHRESSAVIACHGPCLVPCWWATGKCIIPQLNQAAPFSTPDYRQDNDKTTFPRIASRDFSHTYSRRLRILPLSVLLPVREQPPPFGLSGGDKPQSSSGRPNAHHAQPSENNPGASILLLLPEQTFSSRSPSPLRISDSGQHVGRMGLVRRRSRAEAERQPEECHPRPTITAGHATEAGEAPTEPD